jgi:hypothetical protein
VRPYQRGDERRFTPRPDMREEMRRVGWDWTAGAPGPTWTLVRYHDQVLGLGGGFPQGLGAYQVWSALTELPRGDWAPAILCAAAVVRHLEQSHGARRLTVLVRKGFHQAERTMERLGFSRSTEPANWPGYLLMSKGR